MSANERSLRERLRDRLAQAATGGPAPADSDDSQVNDREIRELMDRPEVREQPSPSSRPTGVAGPGDTPGDRGGGGGGGGGGSDIPTRRGGTTGGRSGRDGSGSGPDAGGGGSDDGSDIPARRGGTADGGRSGRDGSDGGGGRTGTDRDGSRPTGPAGPDETPDPAPPDGRGGDQPTGPTGPDQTPDPAPPDDGRGGGRGGDRPTGPTGPDETPPPAPDVGPSPAERVVEGDPDPAITGSLTASEGLFGEETERDLRGVLGRSRRFQQRIRRGGLPFDTEDPTQPVSEEGLGERALEGAATAGVDLLTTPVSAALLADIGVESAQRAPATIDEFGLGPTAATAGAVGVGVGRSIVREARRDPVRFGAGLGFDVAAGGGLGRATSRSVQAGADLRQLSRSRTRVDFGDLTTERGRRGQTPEFETPTDAPTEAAVTEVRERATDQPPEIGDVPELSEGALFRSEAERLPADLEAQAGQFELPGLFASPDVSPLRTALGGGEGSSLRPRAPRLSDFTPDRQTFSAFPGDRVEGLPEGATGTGFAVRDEAGDIVARFPDTGAGAAQARGLAEDIGGERIPDPETSGAQALEAAERGTAFVRPPGSRTPELEAIFPPETRFQRRRQVAVDLPDDELARMDVFERVDQPDAPGGADDLPGDEALTAEEIVSRSRRRSGDAPAGTPTLPTGIPGSGSLGPGADQAGPTLGPSPGRTTDDTDLTGAGTGTSPATDGDLSLPSPTGETPAPSDASGSGTGGPSGPELPPISSGPPSPPTGPASDPAPPTLGPPSSPPTGPPTTPPTAPPSLGPTPPPSSPPAGPPTGPPSGPPLLPDDDRPRRRDDDEDDLFRIPEREGREAAAVGSADEFLVPSFLAETAAPGTAERTAPEQDLLGDLTLEFGPGALPTAELLGEGDDDPLSLGGGFDGRL